MNQLLVEIYSQWCFLRGNTIKEVGIFNSDGSVMLLRVNYDGIGPLTSADDIDFVIVVEVD